MSLPHPATLIRQIQLAGPIDADAAVAQIRRSRRSTCGPVLAIPTCVERRHIAALYACLRIGCPPPCMRIDADVKAWLKNQQLMTDRQNETLISARHTSRPDEVKERAQRHRIRDSTDRQRCGMLSETKSRISIMVDREGDPIPEDDSMTRRCTATSCTA